MRPFLAEMACPVHPCLCNEPYRAGSHGDGSQACHCGHHLQARRDSTVSHSTCLCNRPYRTVSHGDESQACRCEGIWQARRHSAVSQPAVLCHEPFRSGSHGNGSQTCHYGQQLQAKRNSARDKFVALHWSSLHETQCRIRGASGTHVCLMQGGTEHFPAAARQALQLQHQAHPHLIKSCMLGSTLTKQYGYCCQLTPSIHMLWACSVHETCSNQQILPIFLAQCESLSFAASNKHKPHKPHRAVHWHNGFVFMDLKNAQILPKPTHLNQAAQLTIAPGSCRVCALSVPREALTG